MGDPKIEIITASEKRTKNQKKDQRVAEQGRAHPKRFFCDREQEKDEKQEQGARSVHRFSENEKMHGGGQMCRTKNKEKRAHGAPLLK